MSIMVSSARTMAGAKRIVVDEGINIAPPCRKRERLIDLSRRWQMEQKARKERAERALDQAIKKAARKHRSAPILQPASAPTAHTEIISRVAAWHSLTIADVMGKSRSDPIVAARHDAIAAVYLNCLLDGRRYSLPKLGQVFGLDHTSCLFALKKLGVKSSANKVGG